MNPRARRTAHLLLALALLLAVPAPADAEPRAPRPSAPCDWNAEYEGALAELGEDGSRWHLRSGEGVRWGQVWGNVDPPLAVISLDAPCDIVADIVRHEWAHLRQHELYSGPRRETADRRELVADCASLLLGSTELPYVERALADRGAGCLPDELAAARKLAEPALD